MKTKTHLPILLFSAICLFLTVPVYAQTNTIESGQAQNSTQGSISEPEDPKAVKKANKIKAKEEKIKAKEERRIEKERLNASKQASRAAKMEKQAVKA